MLRMLPAWRRLNEYAARAAVVLGLSVAMPAHAEAILGAYPMCEASAATLVDCPDESGRCLLVGDNEASRALFLLRLDDKGAVDAAWQRTLPLGLDEDRELSDIEAVARSAQGRFLLFGSHSRKSDCGTSENRHRIGIVAGLAGTGPVSVEVRQSAKIDCEHLFVDGIRDTPPIKAVCRRIDETERQADAVAEDFDHKKIKEDQAKKRCNEIDSYNAEGAVDIGSGGTPDIWIGLRSPLLPTHPADPSRINLALLLHLNDLGAYTFDRAVALDLDGRGVRDLAAADGWVWLIAGPPQDLDKRDNRPFQLRRFRADALTGEAIVKPELVRDDLPTSSEGLALMGDYAIVVIDGDQGKDCAGNCAIPSRYMVVPLKNVRPVFSALNR